MKSTGKFNPITGKEIFKAEEHDIDFWELDWEDLDIEQKTTFLSFIGAPFLGKQNEEYVKGRYEFHSLKNM